MTIINPTIKILLSHYKEISMLGKIKAVLEWDINVNLPPKAAQERSQQVAYLAEKLTNLWFVPEFRTAIEKIQTLPLTPSQEGELKKEKPPPGRGNEGVGLTLEEIAIVRNLAYGAKYYYKIPKELIIKKETVTAASFVVWKEAKEKNEYHKFFPYLKQIIEMDQEIAQYLGYKENPYDALLDLYEPELTASFCETTFGQLKTELVTLLHKIQASKEYTTEQHLQNGTLLYAIPEQKRLAQFLMTRMGFDFAAGRIDESPHPFTIGLSRNDIRVTTRNKEDNLAECISATMHETGHALYEQGINHDYNQTPLEHGVSLGIHESLSRFWENMIGKNPYFITFLTPILQSFYPEQLGSASETDMINMCNIVRPSLIRIEADEVTYSLHILLRFGMENALMNGKIKPEEAAEAWRAKSKELFGLEPKTDSEGIMQDVHWTYGAFGYFPSYALGNLYGAQFLSVMKQEIDLKKELSQGNLTPVKTWLDTNIHQYGSLYFPKDLVKKVTGEPLNPKYFVEYLNEKYTKIYNLK